MSDFPEKKLYYNRFSEILQLTSGVGVQHDFVHYDFLIV